MDHARTQKWPVIYSNDAHIEGVDREFEVWRPHAIAGSKEAEVIEELKPQKGDYIIPKRRYSGFFDTDLDALLRENGNFARYLNPIRPCRIQASPRSLQKP